MSSASEQASPPIPKHVLAMETALSLLSATARAAVDAPATEADLRPLATTLERATVALLDAYDMRRDPVAALRDAMQGCDEAASAIERAAKVDEGLAGIVDWVRAARDWMRVPETVFARTRAVAPPAREIGASQETPVLQRLDRSTIAPAWKVATPTTAIEKPPSMQTELAKLPPKERLAKLKEMGREMRETAAKRRDERHLAAEERRRAAKNDEAAPPAPGFTKGKHVASTPEQFVARKARELFEDIAAMGLQRTPLLGDFWRGSSVFDRRMLRDIDALAAFGGPAIAMLESLVVDAPAKDPARGFAIAITLGCFEGRDGLAAVERAIRFMGASDPEVRSFAAMALKLAPHPDLPTVLRQWLASPEPGLRAIAIDVLGHKRLATAEELAARCRDEAEDVAASAFIAAALANIPDLGVLIEERKEAKSAALVEALAWATAIGGVPYAADRLRKRYAEGAGDALVVPLALIGEKEHVADLLARFEQAPSRALALALGYAGLPASIDPLVDALDGELAPELKQEIAFSLQRITGAELYDQVSLPAEAIDVEEPEAPRLPDDAPPLRRLASDRRDRPAEGAGDTLALPTTRSEAWHAFLAEDPTRWQGERKLRRGQPYTPAQSLAEIDTYQITPSERRILFRELVVKTGRAVAFDPVDFVADQERALRELAPLAEKASSMPGAWGRALRK